jgi:hypothetical protein
MELTHWMTAVTHAAQQGAHPLADWLTPWAHELSLTALAAAVVMLGCVILLELRALASLRRNVDAHLTRVFEQLDLIRFDHVQLLEAHTEHSAERVRVPQANAAVGTSQAPTTGSTHASPPPAAIAAGEARLLATLAEARKWRAEALRGGSKTSAAVR